MYKNFSFYKFFDLIETFNNKKVFLLKTIRNYVKFIFNTLYILIIMCINILRSNRVFLAEKWVNNGQIYQLTVSVDFEPQPTIM